MTPELQPLPTPLPRRLRWRHTHRRSVWLFDESTCVGSLGFAGYGRASGVTSQGIWHLQRMGMLHLGVTVAPADGHCPPVLMRQTWAFDGSLEVEGERVRWRSAGPQSWCFERDRDLAHYFVFTPSGLLQLDSEVDVCPAAASLAEPSPLLLLGAFLVRLTVDDSVVIAGV